MNESQELPVVYVRELEAERPEERWLIEELWGRAAVGVVGGTPKVGKSWLGLDLALSVASGTPALDRFKVEDSGTALVYLAEDALAQVRARVEALCRHRRLDISGIDLAVITAPILRLDTARDQDRLTATVERFRPRLLLLDPLVRLHTLDENSCQDIARLLGYFRELQRRFDTAVMLVHHTSKKNRSQPGQSLRGSSDLHAFGDSNAYLARKGDDISLTLEHRAARAPAPITLELVSSDGEDTHLRVRDQAPLQDEPPSLESRLLRLLTDAMRPLPRTEIRARLRVNNQRLGDTLTALETRGVIRRNADGWLLVTDR